MGRKAIDLSEKRFDRLVAKKKVKSPNGDKKSYWLCECDCGNKAIVRKDSLESGHAKSCGCLAKEYRPITHGHSRDRLYSIWANMKQRCYNKNDENYKNYGGRGITVCNEWQDYMLFRKWAYENGYDENAKRGECTLDRIDVNGNYEPSNCRWSDKDVQNYNKRETRKLLIDGKEMTLKDICDTYNIKMSTVRGRYQRYIKGLISIDELVSNKKLINKPQQKLITVNGITKNLSEWEKETGICRKTIANRYGKGARSYDELFKESR